MVLDADAPKHLIDQAIALLNDPSRQQVLQQNIGQLARPEAAQQIAEEVLSLVKTQKPKTAE